MTLDEIKRINDRRLAKHGQKYYTDDKVYIGNLDGTLSIYVSVPAQFNPTAGTGIDISGQYPNQTITNTAPDQTVTLTAGTGISISGTYPSFNISSTVTTGILHGTASGTDTYTTTITGVTSYADGDAYLIRFTNGNTIAGPTLNINGLGTITLYRNNDGQLIGGDIWSGSEMLCIYNSTLNAFQCIGTSPNSLFAYVTNDDSVTITKGQVVYAFGGTGDRMTVKLAYNTSDATSAKTVGVVLSPTIATNQKGIIIMQGLLDGLSILPTASYTDGDTLYLGATPGSFTKIKPYAPNHLVYVAIVTTANNGSAGRMYVRCQNGYELDEIHNVNAQNPLDDDIIVYSSGTTLWEKKNIYTAIKTKRDYLITGNQTTTSNLASAVTELVYSASANKRYSVSGYIRIGCNNTGGVRLSVTIPSGASMAIALNGISNSGTSLLYSNINISNTLTGGAYNTFNGTSIINVSGEVELSSTAGNIQFNFASTTNLQTSTIYQLGTLLNFVEL